MRRPPSVILRQQLSSVTRALIAGVLVSGCYSAGDGVSPPGDRVYFPVGLALTDGGQYLAVVNSDFDLQYNAGTLAVFDVQRLRDFVPQPCEKDSDCASATCDSPVDENDREEHSYLCVGARGDDACSTVSLATRSPADRLLYPGRCEYIDPTRPPGGGNPVQTAQAEIGAFATDVIYSERPPSFVSADGSSLGRLFIPVRGDATVHWVDVLPGGEIDCGQQRNRGACDDRHRAGDDHDIENTRDLRLAPEPFGVATDALASAVLVTNQTTGKVSAFSHDWTGDKGDLVLQFEVSNLPTRPMGLAALPTPGLASALLTEKVPSRESYSPGFLVTFRNAPEVDLIRYYPDEASSSERPYAARANAVPITVNTNGSDSRGIAIDDSKRRALEQGCADTARAQGVSALSAECKLDDADCTDAERSYIECLRDQASEPLDVFVASRSPSSLLLGRTTPARNAMQSTELPAFYDTVSLSQGPSRVVLGRVKVGVDAAEQPIFERRVFVSCFDSRRVFVYDPDRRRIDVQIATGRGPHAMAVDERNGLLFIGHFTDSFIGVASLDRRFPHTYGKMLATVGEPSAPRASK